MFELPKKFDREYNTVFRTVGHDVLSGGIIRKEDVTLDWSGGSFPFFSMSIVLRGKGTYTDRDATSYPLYPGRAFLRIPGRNHTTVIEPGSQWLEFYAAVHFKKESPPDFEDNRIPLDRQRQGYLKHTNVLWQDDSWVEGMCRHLFCTMVQGPVRDICLSLSLLNDCYEFLSLLRGEPDETKLPLEMFLLISKLLKSRKEDFSDHITLSIKKVIQENLTNNSPLPELLKSLPLSYPSLRQHFVRITGQSIGEYQIQCRLEKAVTMLMRGASVKETASNLGYKDQFFFSKQFHQKLGYPPSAINPLRARSKQNSSPAQETNKGNDEPPKSDNAAASPKFPALS